MFQLSLSFSVVLQHLNFPLRINKSLSHYEGLEGSKTFHFTRRVNIDSN